MKTRLTLDDIRAMDKDTLTPSEVAQILHCSAYSINVQAQDDLAKLGFRVTVLGRRVLIPRLAFLEFMTGKDPEGGA